MCANIRVYKIYVAPHHSHLLSPSRAPILLSLFHYLLKFFHLENVESFAAPIPSWVCCTFTFSIVYFGAREITIQTDLMLLVDRKVGENLIYSIMFVKYLAKLKQVHVGFQSLSKKRQQCLETVAQIASLEEFIQVNKLLTIRISYLNNNS